MNYRKIDLHAKKSQALVVHCADPRFQKAYRAVIDELGLYYDLVVFPGASKAIADNQLVQENIKLLHNLHSFEIIHVLDHVQCGAFGEVNNELSVHKDAHQRAQKVMSTILSEVKYIAHLLGEESELSLD